MYDGIVNVYKEQGFTSHDVVAKLRSVFGQKKIGHTGTLDPMAEGVLIIVLGRATKLADMILSKKKQYIATMKMGLTSETDDITGERLVPGDETKLSELFSDETELRKKISETFDTFLGKSMQIPPMYSAIKVNGRKLYEYARAGEQVERTPREIEIYSLELLDIDISTKEIKFSVECSKGTYIRSLIRDMGEKLGVGAVMSGLLRDDVNGIKAENAYKISDLIALKEEGRLEEAVLPMDELLRSVPAVSVNESGVKYLSNGNRLRRENLSNIPENTGSSDKSYINTGSADDKSEIYTVIENAQFFRVYSEGELKALYTYDKTKKDFKVYKML